MAQTLTIDGEPREVASAPDTPLLYVLTNELGIQGPRFGCGLAQCGSCSVIVDGKEMRSCVLSVSAVKGRSVTTLKGLAQLYADRKKLAEAPKLHPVQAAMIAEQAPHCGYCYNGMAVKAAELLAANPDPSDQEIRQHMNGHICRCGTYSRILSAIRRAAKAMREQA